MTDGAAERASSPPPDAVAARRRQVVEWCGWLLVAAVSTWWVFHFPYRPGRLADFVPADVAATLVAENLGERWTAYLEHPGVRAIATAAGANLAQADALAANARQRAWIQRVAGRRALVAWTPHFGWERAPALFVSSWLGAESRRLQWLAASGVFPGLERVETRGHRQYYRLWEGDGRTEVVWTIAVLDGILLACRSRDPDGVLAMFEAADRGRGVRLPPARDAADWGVVRVAGRPERGIRPAEVRFAMEAHEANALRVVGEVPGRWLSDDARLTPADDGLLRRLVPPEAVIEAALPYTTLQHLLPARAGALLQYYVQDVLPWGVDVPVQFAVLDGAYNGQLGRGLPMFLWIGVPVPTVLVAARFPPGQDALAGAAAVLDRLNAVTRWGLIPARRALGDEPLFLVESTGAGFYSELVEAERVAYAARDGWLVLASNAGSLRAVLARYDRERAARSDAAFAAAGAGRARADLARLELNSRLLLAAARLFLARGEDGDAMRGRLAEVEASLQALAGAGELDARVEQEEDRLVWSLHLGSPGQIP